MTIMEVMMSVLVFALVMSAISSSWYTLRHVQRLTREENKAYEIAQALSERIVGANWDWIGRDRPDELKPVTVTDNTTDPPTITTVDVIERYWRRYAWSWHRREMPRVPGSEMILPPLSDRDWNAADYARLRSEDGLVGGFTPVTSESEFNPHNLVDIGLLEGPTGVPNLQVYIEYYHADLLDNLFIQPLANHVVTDYWKQVVSGEMGTAVAFPESPFAADDPENQMNPADQNLAMKAMVVRIIVTWGDKPKLHRHEVVLARRK